MRLAFLNTYCGVINRGGETFTKELATHLSKRNQVTVYQSGKSTGNEEYEVVQIPVNWNWKKKNAEEKFISRLFLDYWNRKIFIFSLKAFEKIIKGKYDVVIPVNGGWMPAVMRIATWISGKKLLITGQSGIGWDDRNNLWSFPNAFVGLSTKATNWAKKANPFVKSFYIPNGVETDNFKPKSKKDKNGEKTILAVGAFTKQKRLDLVIKAVSKLSDTKLIIAGGGGDLKNELEKLAKKLLKNRFEIIEAKYKDMPKIYAKADLFTLASGAPESFGIVYLEAMASGLPVVAGDDPIRKEIIGNAGIFVDPSNTDSYAKALVKALNTKWGEKPRKQAERFDWDIIAKKYEKLLESI